MESEDFYTTTAQLLAAFAIALLVVLPGIWRQQTARLRGATRQRQEALYQHHLIDMPTLSYSEDKKLGVATLRWAVECRRQARLYRAVQGAASLFLTGEAMALTALLTGADGGITLLAGPVVLLATMALAALTVLTPIVMLRDRPSVDGLLPSSRHIDRVRAEFGGPSRGEQSRSC
ncbi:hypothetical protein [Paractinoplanes abujensis]|uniref:ABC-type transport system involved in cytochrome bd biosynthesis fused ATPase/permease subunit n=1 Tax=Paractinoplanes abujensis TaxID=882441 RepID=A0A7W7CWG4_9ACTN|nr:hypothetical protein [Actinoplanes abujensis]MBB4694730.1 ABC-type transport system involved in cytochrome bd biosynthesis fused ATPase/permease subunit [Actinoplanes abujensis]